MVMRIFKGREQQWVPAGRGGDNSPRKDKSGYI